MDADLNCGFRGIDVGKLVDFFFFFFISIGFVRRRGGLEKLKSARFWIFVEVGRFWVISF